MNSQPELASTYRGKILLSFRIEEGDGDDPMKEEAKVIRIPSPGPSDDIPTQSLVLRMLLVAGCELPEPKMLDRISMTGKTQCHIKLSWGLWETEIGCDTKGLVNGSCTFLSGHTKSNGLVDSKPMSFPKDESQIPDIFVYYCVGEKPKRDVRGNLTGSDSSKKVSYFRIKASQLLSKPVLSAMDRWGQQPSVQARWEVHLVRHRNHPEKEANYHAASGAGVQVGGGDVSTPLNTPNIKGKAPSAKGTGRDRNRNRTPESMPPPAAPLSSEEVDAKNDADTGTTHHERGEAATKQAWLELEWEKESPEERERWEIEYNAAVKERNRFAGAGLGLHPQWVDLVEDESVDYLVSYESMLCEALV